MLLVGLTGGIGSGKSTVASMLERMGAVVVDADDLARQAIAPGTPGHARVVEEFGPEAVGGDGEIDRARLARRVFTDPVARRRLESIVHPEVARLFAESVAAHRNTDRIVVYVVPLLVERSLQDAVDEVVVVSAAPETRLARLRAARGMDEEDVEGRMAAQLPDEERIRAADVVIDNDGSLAELERRVGDLWTRLRRREQG